MFWRRKTATQPRVPVVARHQRQLAEAQLVEDRARWPEVFRRARELQDAALLAVEQARPT
jgi:hypothetical protein